MPALNNADEIFAQCLVKGLTQADAYREAYPKSKKWKDTSLHPKASTLSKSDKIRARVAEIRAPVVETIQYGLLDAMIEAKRAMDLAEDSGQAGAMVAAVQLRAKLNALLVERKEIAVTQMAGMTPLDKQFLLEAATRTLTARKAGDVTDVEAKGG